MLEFSTFIFNGEFVRQLTIHYKIENCDNLTLFTPELLPFPPNQIAPLHVHKPSTKRQQTLDLLNILAELSYSLTALNTCLFQKRGKISV